MLAFFKNILWKQFGGSIDMLTNAIELCPDELWLTHKKFFYSAYHCTVFLEYYLSIPPENFAAQLPYTLISPDEIPAEAIDDVLPGEIYSRQAMLLYLQNIRIKAKTVIAALTEATLQASWMGDPGKDNLDLVSMDAGNYSVLEILLHNMRHVQHHAAQMNGMLRQAINKAPDYVSHAADDLDAQKNRDITRF